MKWVYSHGLSSATVVVVVVAVPGAGVASATVFAVIRRKAALAAADLAKA